MQFNPTGKLAPVFGIAAVAMTAAILGLTVYVPANLGQSQAAVSRGHTPVAIVPSRIEVIGVRLPRTAAHDPLDTGAVAKG